MEEVEKIRKERGRRNVRKRKGKIDKRTLSICNTGKR